MKAILIILAWTLSAAAGATVMDTPALGDGGRQGEEINAGQLRLAGPFGYRPAIQLSAKAHFRVTGLPAR